MRRQVATGRFTLVSAAAPRALEATPRPPAERATPARAGSPDTTMKAPKPAATGIRVRMSVQLMKNENKEVGHALWKRGASPPLGANSHAHPFLERSRMPEAGTTWRGDARAPQFTTRSRGIFDNDSAPVPVTTQDCPGAAGLQVEAASTSGAASWRSRVRWRPPQGKWSGARASTARVCASMSTVRPCALRCRARSSAGARSPGAFTVMPSAPIARASAA